MRPFSCYQRALSSHEWALSRHPRLSPVIPAQAGIQGALERRHWIPACAGKTYCRDATPKGILLDPRTLSRHPREGGDPEQPHQNFQRPGQIPRPLGPKVGRFDPIERESGAAAARAISITSRPFTPISGRTARPQANATGFGAA